MFPLKERQVGGYSFGQPTSYSKFHLGTDYKASPGTEVYAPFDGKVVNTLNATQAKQGGNTIWYEFNQDGQKWIARFMHLNDFKGMGNYKKGDLIAHTGNTGQSTGPHLHLDISKNDVEISNKNNFVDPEKFNWHDQEEVITMIKYYDQLSDQDKQWVRKFVQDFVANFYKQYFFRDIESQAMLDAHTNTILNDKSGDGWNGIGHWIQGVMNDKNGEFYAHWQKK